MLKALTIKEIDDIISAAEDAKTDPKMLID
jgi:hypothetical protein